MWIPKIVPKSGVPSPIMSEDQMAKKVEHESETGDRLLQSFSKLGVLRSLYGVLGFVLGSPDLWKRTILRAQNQAKQAFQNSPVLRYTQYNYQMTTVGSQPYKATKTLNPKPLNLKP